MHNLCSHYRGSNCPTYIPMQVCNQNWASGLVGGFMNSLGLLLTHDWWIFVLLAPYYSSDTKTDWQVEISIPFKASAAKPDFNSILFPTTRVFYFGSSICGKFPLNRISQHCLLHKGGCHPRNFNGHGCFDLSWSWYPVTNMTVKCKYINLETRPSQANSWLCSLFPIDFCLVSIMDSGLVYTCNC